MSHPTAINLANATDSDIARVSELLVSGGVIIVPTDTVYGVAAHPLRQDAVERIYEIKGRQRGKPLPLLASDREAVDRFGGHFCREAKLLAAHYWPGPLTMVLPSEPGHREGFRVPDHEGLRAVLRAVGGVLRVTSANRSGYPDPVSADEARRALGHGIDLVLDAGPAAVGLASSVVSVVDGSVVVLREGAVSKEDIQRVARRG